MNDQLSKAVWGTLQSVNEWDSNGEAANVVDGLFAIARGLHHVAEAIEHGRVDADYPRPPTGPEIPAEHRKPRPARHGRIVA